MKFKKQLFSVMIATMLLTTGIGFAQINHQDSVAHAASSQVDTTQFPESITGTWYAYTNFGYGKKKIYKLTINAKKFNFHPYKNHEVIFNTTHLSGKKKTYFNKTSKWTYYTVLHAYGYKWFNFRGWQQSAGAGDYYTVNQFGKYKVLSLGGGAGAWVSANYYQSKKVAKAMGQKHYPGFKYYNNND